MISYILIFGVFMLLSWLISYQLKSRFKKYSKIPMNKEITGRDVAEKMLRDNGIYAEGIGTNPESANPQPSGDGQSSAGPFLLA